MLRDFIFGRISNGVWRNEACCHLRRRLLELNGSSLSDILIIVYVSLDTRQNHLSIKASGSSSINLNPSILPLKVWLESVTFPLRRDVIWHNLQCTIPWMFQISSVFLKRADTRGSSASSSPPLLSQPCVLQTVSCPLCTLETNADIWNISVFTPPYPTLHLDKIVLQLLSLFPASTVPATIKPPNIFF